MQKDSPYQGVFNYYIDHLWEHGALERIYQKWAALPPKREDRTGKPLGFKGVLTAFLVIISGICIGIIMLAMEFLLSWIMKPDKKLPENKWTESQGGDKRRKTLKKWSSAQDLYL